MNTALVLIEQSWIFWFGNNVEDLETGSKCCHKGGVYILKNTIMVGGGNFCWGKIMKTEGVREKMKKKGKGKEEKNGLKTE